MKDLSNIAKELGSYQSVSNMANNQVNLSFENGRVFQSYNSVIAVKVFGGKTYLTPHWDYSNTTGQYRNKFLGCNKKECKQKIKSGEFELVSGTKF